MSSNSTSPVASESNGSSSSGVSSTTACDDRTCSTAKCALCLHCSQQYCFVHFLKHNEQLSLNAYNFTLAIDQLGKLKVNFDYYNFVFLFVEDQIKNLKLDESLRRTIHSLDQWRKNLVRTIEYVYQEKLSSIKANYIQLSNCLQQFQFEQSSHIQTLRIDLEQMKFIRSTYGLFIIFLSNVKEKHRIKSFLIFFRSRDRKNSNDNKTITKKFLRTSI
jgi:hypothetical protein